MTITVELPDNLEAALKAQANAKGLSEAGYVRTVLERDLMTALPAGSKKKRLSELFASLRGLDVDFSRNPSTGRPVNL